MRNLVLQLIFGIGCDGAILPNQDVVLHAPPTARALSTTAPKEESLGSVLQNLSTRDWTFLPKQLARVLHLHQADASRATKGGNGGEIEMSSSSRRLKRKDHQPSGSSSRSSDVVWHGNMTQIALNTLSSVLDFTWFCESKQLTDSQLPEMSHVYDKASCCLVELYNLRQKVFRISGMLTKKTLTAAVEIPRNIKTHGCGHLPLTVPELGPDPNVFDTTLGEKGHQVVVTKAFSRSSGVVSTTSQEMARFVIISELSQQQAATCAVIRKGTPRDEWLEAGKSAIEEEEQVSSGGDDRLRFHVIWNLGSTELQLSQNDYCMFSVVAKKGNSRVKTTVDRIEASSPILHLHPLLTPNELYSLITCAVRNGSSTNATEYERELAKFWSNFASRADHSIHLCGGVRGDALPDKGIKEFYLRATNCYRGKGIRSPGYQVFNNFEVDYPKETYAVGDEPTTFAKTLALVGFKSQTSFHLWIALARYKKMQTVRTSSGIQFPFAQYALETTTPSHRLSIDFVPVQSVKRPCFMTIPCDAEKNLRFETNLNLRLMRWYCIPFHRAVKTTNVTSGIVSTDATDHIASKLREFDLEKNCHFTPNRSFLLGKAKAGGGGGGGGGGGVGASSIGDSSESEIEEEEVAHWDSDDSSNEEIAEEF